MRITSGTMHLTVRNGLARAIERVQIAQDQVSTGLRINKYSDAPSDAVNVLRTIGDEAAYRDFERNAGDSFGWLAAQDEALQGMTGSLREARDIALNAKNGSMSAEALKTMAARVRSIRDQVAQSANSTYLDRPVFGGFGNQAVALVGGSYAFAGDAGAVNRQVSPNTTLRVNVDGAEMLGFNAGNDVFAVLDALAADLDANDTSNIATRISDIDTRAESMHTALSQVGSTQLQIEALEYRGAGQIISLQKVRSELQEVDLAKAVLDMKQAELGYQAALGAASRANLPSLADYLR